MLSYRVRGSTDKMEAFLLRASKVDILGVMRSCGQEGVDALAKATPKDSGLTASSWSYSVSASGGVYTIYWTNSDVENGFPVALTLQYGHGTGTGGYVQGRDYINPALRPVFDRIATKVWKAVTSA